MLIALLTACGPVEGDVTPTSGPPDVCPLVLDGDGFFERPFPHDDRLVDGRASYEGFPNRSITLVDEVLTVAELHAGWSPWGTAYVAFDAPIWTEGLPDLAGSLEPDSRVRLAPVDPADGPAVPVHVRFFDEATSLLPANTLAVRPAWGTGMRPGVRYELRLSGDIGCDGDASGVVIPITTAPVNDTLRDMVAVAREQLPAGAALGAKWAAVDAPAPGSSAWVGELTIPRWQVGEVPYASEGGEVRFDADGMPIIDGFDAVPVAFVSPGGEPPAGGWPVVVHLNGTGSTHLSTLSASVPLAPLGVAVVGIDLPLHGARGAGPAFEQVVNIDNPMGSLYTLLQGAADQVWLVDLLARDGAFVDTPDGPVPLDPSRIGYQGHSQGGIHGALAAAHFDGQVVAAQLSGAGGGTFQGALLNESTGIDVAGLIGLLFGFEDGEELDDFHPLATVIQHAADPADPLNTAPYWFAEPGLQDHPLGAVLVSLGTDDVYTPALTTQAMAHAAGVPIARGDYRIPADEVFPPQIDALPVADNTAAFDGGPVTAGLVQYPDGDHFVGMVDIPRWSAFFGSALVEDAPRIP